jgi:hypothetical protein
MAVALHAVLLSKSAAVGAAAAHKMVGRPQTNALFPFDVTAP